MAGQLYGVAQHPPPLYRLARGLRRASLIVLVLLLLFVASVAYSAVGLTRSSSSLSQVSTAFAPNDTVVIAGTLTLANPSWYPIHGLTIAVRVANDSAGAYLGGAFFGPVNLASQGMSAYPINVYVPLTASGPGESLLTQNQVLRVGVWANATYAYMFPAAISIHENRSWGAPFAHLDVSVGAVTIVNGTATVPVTLSFQNEASFGVAGSLQFAVQSSAGVTCGNGAFVLNVGPNQQYSQTTSVSMATGCNPSGGQVVSEYVTPAYTIPLPPEAIP